MAEEKRLQRHVRSDLNDPMSLRAFGIAGLIGAALSAVARPLTAQNMLQGAGAAVAGYALTILVATEEVKPKE